MADNIVIGSGFQGVKIYKMKTNKTLKEITDWCQNNVKPHIQVGGVAKAVFYIVSQPGTDLYMLVCVHDLQNSNWSGATGLPDFNDINFARIDEIYKFP